MLSVGVVAEAQQTTPVALRAIAVAPRGGQVVVTISGGGLLPRPRVGVLLGPPRIYLDFKDVVAAVPREVSSTDARIVRVRVGVHLTPPSTRVVIDLTLPQPHRLELEPGIVRVVIGSVEEFIPQPAVARPIADPAPKVSAPPPAARAVPAAPDIAPVPALSPPPIEQPTLPRENVPAPVVAPPAVTYSSPPSPPLPAKDLDRYRKQLGGALDRLRLQQPWLMTLDAGQAQTADRVQMAVAEFDRLRQDLTAIKPPETLLSQHSMLVQSSTLAWMAANLRLESLRTEDVTTTRNASSAAAGAILLLDRVCAVLTCPAVAGR
jgi:hypothetical protein